MCGRFLLLSSGRELADAFDLPDAPLFERVERYNIAPGQVVPVILQPDTGRVLRSMNWGLIPSWAKDAAIGFKSINARSETVAEKPTFRAAFKRRHCLVPASGFYEWRTVGKQKLLTLFRHRSGFFALAGIWETWEGDGSPVETFAVLTTAANEVVAPTHDRMPVIIGRDDFASWLAPSGEKEKDVQLLRPYSADLMLATAANPWVNDARHEGPKCIGPEEGQPSLFS